MTSIRIIARPIAALAFAGTIVGGCNTALLLDNDKLQQVIAEGLQTQAGVSASVTCPDDRPIKQGDTFTCTAQTTDGDNLTITVVQTDDTGRVNWNVTGAS